MSSPPASETSATPVTDAAPAGASRQSTLCAGSWPRPWWRSVAAPPAESAMDPPFNCSVFASTAMPRVDSFGLATR